MKYIIHNDPKNPGYRQLYQQIRTDIIQGTYPYGTRLPSKRTIAAELGISTVTVEHSYSLLCDEGYIESAERSGYFVCFRTEDNFSVSDVDVPLKKSASFPTGQFSENMTLPSLDSTFPISVLTKTMRRVINDLGENLLAKAPNSGCVELRLALSQYLKRSRGIDVYSDQIIIGSGSEYLYGLIIELLGREKVYAIESPSYKKIEQVYRAADVRYEMLPLSHDGIESTALYSSKADVLHITPYRSYPSGVTASASKRHEYMRWAMKEERFIIEDDYESEFTVSKKPEETLFSNAATDNIIYMNTFSKTISPSLRMGYMVLPKSLVNLFNEKLGFYSCTVPTFEQFVLTELLQNGDFERHINRVRRKKRKEIC